MSTLIVNRLTTGSANDTYWLVGTGFGVVGSATTYTTRELAEVVALTVKASNPTLNILCRDMVSGVETQITNSVIGLRSENPAVADQFYLVGTGWGLLSAATIYATRELALYWAKELAEGIGNNPETGMVFIKDQVNGIEYPIKPI